MWLPPSYDKDTRMLARLAAGQQIDPQLSARFEDELRNRLADVVRGLARRNNVEGLRQLSAIGLIEGQLRRIVDIAIDEHSPACVSFLLELERNTQDSSPLDFEV